MAKVDGRTLRRVIREYVETNYPGKKPVFNIRTVTKKVYSRKYAVLDVRFDELDQDALDVWSDVADWVLDKWWPKNKNNAKTVIREWDGGYRGEMVKRIIPITHIEVGYGFTH